MQISTGFATIQNARLYFETAGKGRPLILLHSGITDHRMWAEQLREFSKHFHVIAPDFRGYGKSSAPDERFWHFDDIYRLIQELAFRSVYVGGCSLGGKAAMELAIAYPKLISALILIAPGLPSYQFRDKETLEKDMILGELIASEKRDEVADTLMDIWLVGLKRKRESVASSVRVMVREMILDNYDSVIDKYPERKPKFNVLSRLSEIHVPTLVMIGDCDLPDMLAISQLVADRISGAERRLLHNTAHLPNLECSALFNDVVIDFLKNHSGNL